MNQLVEFLSSLPFRLLAVLADFSILFAAYRWIRGRFYKTIHLTSINATFKIRKKDFNVQSITNAVSQLYKKGAQLPPPVREEIIKLTVPKIKDWQCTTGDIQESKEM